LTCDSLSAIAIQAFYDVVSIDIIRSIVLALFDFNDDFFAKSPYSPAKPGVCSGNRFSIFFFLDSSGEMT
jgi:hypothetical protein